MRIRKSVLLAALAGWQLACTVDLLKGAWRAYASEERATAFEARSRAYMDGWDSGERFGRRLVEGTTASFTADVSQAFAPAIEQKPETD